MYCVTADHVNGPSRTRSHRRQAAKRWTTVAQCEKSRCPASSYQPERENPELGAAEFEELEELLEELEDPEENPPPKLPPPKLSLPKELDDRRRVASSLARRSASRWRSSSMRRRATSRSAD